jgi:hypothetical protein
MAFFCLLEVPAEKKVGKMLGKGPKASLNK